MYIAIIIVLIAIGVLTVANYWNVRQIVAYHRARAVSEPSDEIVERVIRIVAENRGMDTKDVFLGMTLEGDLGITGDDADDVFDAFAKEFPDVDLNGVDLGLYFGPEGMGAPFAVWCRRGPVRVSDLVQAARDKRWHTVLHSD